MKKFIPLALSLPVIVVGFFFSNPLLFGSCRAKYQFGNNIGCLDDTVELIGVPFLIYGIALLVVGVANATMFTERDARWLKFALFWLPLSILLIAITPTVSNTAMPLYFIGRETLTWVLAILFTLISIILIALSFFRKK